MKFPAKKKKVLILVAAVLIVLSLNIFQKEVRGSFYGLSSPIQKTLWRTGDRVASFFDRFTSAKIVKKENEQLQIRNRALTAEVTALKEIQQENEILREVLDLGLREDFEMLFAGVVGKDLSGDFLIIDQGLSDGVQEGFPVITQQKVMVGTISEAYQHTSKVMLVSHPQSALNTKVADTNSTGLVRGAGNYHMFLDLIPQETVLQQGDLLITSKLGGSYPAGLLIGLIEKVEKVDVKPFQQAAVSPFFDITSSEHVFVITRF